jgi:hypothetical protein
VFLKRALTKNLCQATLVRGLYTRAVSVGLNSE